MIAPTSPAGPYPADAALVVVVDADAEPADDRIVGAMRDAPSYSTPRVARRPEW